MAASSGLKEWSRQRHMRRLREAAAISPAEYKPKAARLRKMRIGLFFLVVALCCAYLDNQSIFAWIESYAYNTASSSRADLRPSTQRTRTDIVIVALTDNSFSPENPDALPSHPVPRDYHARLIDIMSKAGARMVIFDILFEASRPQDDALAAAIRRARQRGTEVVLATMRGTDERWQLPNQTLLKAGPQLGHILVTRSEDYPAIERLKAYMPGPKDAQGHSSPLPALSLRAAQLMQPNVSPPLENGFFSIRYSGRVGESFPFRPYDEVMSPGADQAFFQKFWHGKLVFVGDATKIGQDYQDTPLGVMPGVEVHAHALNTLLEGHFLRNAPLWLRILCVLLIGLPIVLWHGTSRVRILIGSFLVLFVAYMLLFFWAFMYFDYVLHLVGPLVALITITLGVLIERGLHEERERERMFDALVLAASSAIESRDPSTAGHSRRVTSLTVSLAIAVSGVREGPFRKRRYSRREIKELCYSALLHDFGKIGVREAVLTKSHKLDPLHFQAVKYRVLLLKNGRQSEYMNAKIRMLSNPGEDDAETLQSRVRALDEEMHQEMIALDKDVELLEKANNPQVTYLPDEDYESLQELLDRMEAHAFYDEAGERRPLISSAEKTALSIRKGSLTEDEYKQIQQHAQLSYEFLRQIPWTADFKDLTYIAWGHHEKLNGRGYPRGVSANEIPLSTRMMTIADIFDALTASDRPYKKSLPLERALNILREEVGDGSLDGELLEVFISEKVYEAAQDKTASWLFPGRRSDTAGVKS